jgi:hypothetical protein
MYVRDKRSPVPKNEAVSRVMSANRGKDSGPEVLLRKALWQRGFRGYRLHYKSIPGRPDIAFVLRLFDFGLLPSGRLDLRYEDRNFIAR